MSVESTEDTPKVFQRANSVSRQSLRNEDPDENEELVSNASSQPDKETKRLLKRKSFKNSDDDLSESDSTTSLKTASVRSSHEGTPHKRSKMAERRERCGKARSCCNVLLFLFKMSIIVASIVLLVLLFIGFFLSKFEFQCKLDELGPGLYSNIYGQDVAIKKTLDSVTDFCSGSYDRPLTLVFWGPTGVGKTALASIFLHHFDSNGQIIPSENFKAAKYKDLYGSRVHNKPFVFTIDDVMTVENMGDIAANTNHFSFPLILVITTSLESNLLNESFVDWCVKGGDELDYVYRGKDPLWLTELSHLNPVVVPFLPLSRTSIKLCIEKTLNRLKMSHVKDDIEKIANEFEYFHNNKRLFSKIGCKRVNDKIFSVLSP